MPSSNRSSLSNPNRNPGPGSYSLSANPEGPFFSLKGRNSSTKPFKTPGPGNYDPNYYATLETIPSFRVGSSKRDFPLSSNSTPGPGNYDPVVSPLKTSINFGKSSRSDSYDNAMPGPGSYSVKEEKLGFAYSMTPRRQVEVKTSTPGPGSYSSFMRTSGPGFTLGKGQRKNEGKSLEGPGPGSYNPEPAKSHSKNLCTLYLDLL